MEVKIGQKVKVNDYTRPYPMVVEKIEKQSGGFYAHLYNAEHNDRCIAEIVEKVLTIVD